MKCKLVFTASHKSECERVEVFRTLTAWRVSGSLSSRVVGASIIRLFFYACLYLFDFSFLVLLTFTRFAGDFDSLYLHRDLGPRIVKAS